MSENAAVTRAEDDTPLTERILLVESRAGNVALERWGSGLPLPGPNEEALFLSFNYADLPVGKRFDCCCPRDDETRVVWTTVTIIAGTQQMALAWDDIPHGWKTLTILRFDPEIPSIIRDLPETAGWYEQPITVHISSKDTWTARTSEQ
ncbi:hypothetical protein [Actinomadura sp. HBU206391]|uniref:hypothetical protein n=1 Tax=Actinomadura sp. HBU206391 TaxID=2731692 RepID=UPI00164F9AD4|nr:hypothetical protein [Actinomadura sp. HBU206391]MBC6462070.1 hypothetical protein [Actinomadura sp. HBU206391]